jgi:predicted CoA-binding protein
MRYPVGVENNRQIQIEVFMNEQPMEKIMAEAKTIAVVGFSSNAAKAGQYVPAYLKEQGYRIIPVNPNLREGLGETAVPSLTAITEPVDLVLIFQRSENVPPFVDEAIAIEAKAVWMQLGIAHEAAAEKARAAGLDVVQNACMLVEHKRWVA